MLGPPAQTGDQGSAGGPFQGLPPDIVQGLGTADRRDLGAAAAQGPGQIRRAQGSDAAGDDQGDAAALEMAGDQGHVMVADRSGLGRAEIPVVEAGGHGKGPAWGRDDVPILTLR